MGANLKLIFGFPVAEWFIYSEQLYYSIKKFCHDPLVLFSSNKNIGYSYERLTKIKGKREYRLYQIHNFLFDVFEEIRGLDFDYFVKLDSDCLFANFGFEEIFTKKFDFLDSVDENDNKCKWWQAKEFFKNIASYQRLISDLKLTRKDSRISGCLGALQAYSKKAIDFIADRIKIIENSPGYIEMIQKDLCLSELLVPNLLKDAGFEYRIIYLHKEEKHPPLCVRWRPYISKKEVKSIENCDLSILYHPLKRALRDKTRRILLKKIGYRYGLIIIYMYILKKIRDSLKTKVKLF